MKNFSSGAKNDKYFRTDHLKSDIKGRSVRGGAITITAQAVKFCLNLGSNAALARLLTPQDYGLVGMVTAVIGFITLFKDLGLSMATVQKEDINHEQVNTLFWLNVLLSVVTALITIILAPVIASFYHEPRLVWITISLAAGFIISGLGVQHSALLNRQMHYRTLVYNDLISMLIGVIAAIVAGFYGASYWALVIMTLVTATVSTVGFWIACSWRPGYPSKSSDVRSMLAFGGNLTGFNIINYCARNMDNILIGRYWGTQQLGLYAKAYQLLLLPIQQINTPVSKVAMPALSRMQHDPTQFRQYYLKALSLITFITTPMVIFMIVAAREIIQLILGNQWSETSVIFQLLAISAIVQPIYNTAGLLYMSTGRTNRMFQWGGLISGAIICSFFCGLPYGAKGVALSYAIAMLLLVIPAMYGAIYGLSITLLDLMNAVKFQFLASILAGAASYAVRITIYPNFPTIMTLITCFIVMGLVYLLFMFYVFKMKKFYLDIIVQFKK